MLPESIRRQPWSQLSGSSGFDYVGDRAVDFRVWTQARHALAVSHNGIFERRLKKRLPDAEIVERVHTNPRDLIRALRPHQWSKNLLLFIPAPWRPRLHRKIARQCNAGVRLFLPGRIERLHLE